MDRITSGNSTSGYSPECHLDENQLALLAHIARITSISNLDELLDIVMTETPRLMMAAGCSIYLVPNLVPQYDGTLIEGDLVTQIQVDDIPRDFIVLAATSRPNTDRLVGKAYYQRGEGISGWVFDRGRSLRINDICDVEELKRIDPNLRWSDRYGGSLDYYTAEDIKPILVVPLIANGHTIGVFKVPAMLDKQPFNKMAEQIATIIAQVVANVIRQNWVVKAQEQTILKLVEISAIQEPERVFTSVTESLIAMLSCLRCRLYLRSKDGRLAVLVAEDGALVDNEHAVSFLPSEGLVGWVLQTDKPLILEDALRYSERKYLGDDLLEQISDGRAINGQDRWLAYIGSDHCGVAASSVPFLAVPIEAHDGSVLGVLCALCAKDGDGQLVKPFTTRDLQVIRSFASTISIAVENERERRLGTLLTSLGYYWEPEKLFDLVVDEIQMLVPSSGCCIYTLERSAGSLELELVRSSRFELGDDVSKSLSYQIGQGKTGFCALTRRTLVVNHFGPGQISRQRMEAELKRIQMLHINDLVAELKNTDDQWVGIVQLRRGKTATADIEKQLNTFSKGQVLAPSRGLTSAMSEQHAELNLSPSYSFVAVPITYEEAHLYGVITLGRPTPRYPFSAEEVSLVESIAHRVGTEIHNLKEQEQREYLLMTLAHEVNTPLTGILADSENLVSEAGSDTDLREMAEHNLGQVRRLQLQSESILAVLPGSTAPREFTVHSIYRPLIQAVELFESEAQHAGCDILPPRALGPGPRFPDMEMSLFDMTLAFQNLVHNAVKYSFLPPKGQEGSRYIRIEGRWADGQHYSISIQNYGVGITKEEIENRLIFAHYRGEMATDRQRTGAGLGLVYVRQVIEDMHNGSLGVTSERASDDGYLTTFTVTLPIRQSHIQP